MSDVKQKNQLSKITNRMQRLAVSILFLCSFMSISVTADMIAPLSDELQPANTTSWRFEDLRLFPPADLQNIIDTGQRYQQLLPQNQEAWREDHIHYLQGEPVSYQRDDYVLTDLFQPQDKEYQQSTNLIPYEDEIISIQGSSQYAVSVQEYDENQRALHDSDWQNGQISYHSRKETRYIAISLKAINLRKSQFTADPQFQDLSVGAFANLVVKKGISATGEALQLSSRNLRVLQNFYQQHQQIRQFTTEVTLAPGHDYLLTYPTDSYHVFSQGDQEAPITSDSILRSPAPDGKMWFVIKNRQRGNLTLADLAEFDLQLTPVPVSDEPAPANPVKLDEVFIHGEYGINEHNQVLPQPSETAGLVSKEGYLLPANLPLKIDLQEPDAYQFQITITNQENVKISQSRWVQGAYYYTAAENQKLWLAIKKTDNSAIEPQELQGMQFQVLESPRPQRVIAAEQPLIIAHRGGNQFAPENTLAALREAANHGFKAVEFDVQLTADQVPVIMHDTNVIRMTNGTGDIKNMSFSQIKKLKIDAGNNLKTYPNEGVPTLSDMLTLCDQLGLTPMVHFNHINQLHEADIVVQVIREHGFIDKALLLPPNNDVIYHIKKLAPELMTCYIDDVMSKEIDPSVVTSLPNMIVAGWFYNNTLIDPNWSQQVLAHGIPLSAFVINDKATYQKALAEGARIITTDNAELLK